MIIYPRQTELPEDYIKWKIDEFLREDAPDGDRTSLGSIEMASYSTAEIRAQQDLILAGLPIIRHFYHGDAELEIFFKDGDLVNSGDTIARIGDSTMQILTTERILLNLLQRMCGIATETRRYVDIAEPHGVKILDTRKTTPGLRLFEKYAVAMGGGYNHRLNLSSGILIKDNHLKAGGGVMPTINKIMKYSPEIPVELEADHLEQVKEAMETDVDGFLLDNMDPDMIRRGVNLIRKFAGGDEKFIEASGGITLNNLSDYVTTGIDAISIGALTHSVKSADINMEIVD